MGRRQKSRNRSKRSPSVSFMHQGKSYDAIIYPNRSFTSVIIDGAKIKGEIIGSSHDTFNFRKLVDSSIIKVSLSDLTNCDENKDYKSSSVTESKSYKEVLSNTSSSSKSASSSNSSNMNLNNDFARDREKLETKRSRIEKELLMEENELLKKENELLKKYFAPK